MNSARPHSELIRLVEKFDEIRIGVVGDLMHDRYYRGSCYRISPEAPVPVVEIEEESEHPGGAANVALNLARLGTGVSLFGVIGDDTSGDHLAGMLGSLGIDGAGLVVEPNRPTTAKTRVIAAGQHIVRADRETQGEISSAANEELLRRLIDQLSSFDALLLQDYDKGVFSQPLISRVLETAREADVPTFVDPKRKHFWDYQGCTLFKPNLVETQDALGHRLASPETRIEAAATLLERLATEAVVLTLGGDGMLLLEREADAQIVPTRALQVADVSGAGDTVIATIAAMRAAGASVTESVVAANVAAGIVCELVGTVPIQRSDLIDVLRGDGDDQ